MNFSADTSAKFNMSINTGNMFSNFGGGPQRKLSISINTGSWFSGNTTNFGGSR
jgi:hypothetical protein